jgi:hypothetical protein
VDGRLVALFARHGKKKWVNLRFRRAFSPCQQKDHGDRRKRTKQQQIKIVQEADCVRGCDSGTMPHRQQRDSKMKIRIEFCQM